jgi:hypothetical protein
MRQISPETPPRWPPNRFGKTAEQQKNNDKGRKSMYDDRDIVFKMLLQANNTEVQKEQLRAKQHGRMANLGHSPPNGRLCRHEGRQQPDKPAKGGPPSQGHEVVPLTREENQEKQEGGTDKEKA